MVVLSVNEAIMGGKAQAGGHLRRGVADGAVGKVRGRKRVEKYSNEVGYGQNSLGY